MSNSAPNPLLELRKLGESAWLDDISRSMIEDGSLARLDPGRRHRGADFQPLDLRQLHHDRSALRGSRSRSSCRACDQASAIYEELALEDLQDAAQLLRPLYDSSGGGDGFVSMEVSPHLAYDTPGSLAEAQRLWARLQLPNAFIKIPGTEAGLPVIRDLIAAGINVNVTLLFSPERYRAVAQAYMDGLARAPPRGRASPRSPRWRASSSAASTRAVDKQLDALAARGQPAARSLRGKAAIASACRAYEIFEQLTAGSEWQALAARGARPQRLLWASTSAKDPTFSPVKYVEELVVPGTVNTMPLETSTPTAVSAARSCASSAIIAEASDVREGLERLDVDMEVVAQQLEREGVTNSSSLSTNCSNGWKISAAARVQS